MSTEMGGFVHVEAAHGVGHLTLNRTGALNALTTPMIAELSAALLQWREDPAIKVVLLDSASPKAFCAGGDIRWVQQAVVSGEPELALAFFAAEYRLNLMIAEYPKPYISVVDGFNFGGGLGLSVHGRHHVVTERAVLAMPETAIGFFPDIGASFFLPRLSGQSGAIGRYLGLTGHRVAGADAVHVGLATHFLASQDVPGFTEALLSGDPVAAVLDHLHTPAPDANFTQDLKAIEHHFSTDDLTAIHAGLNVGLQDGGDRWITQTRAELSAASPRSLSLTTGLLSRGARSDLRAVLRTDYAVAATVIRSHDFIDGVRAMLIDKDRNPQWQSDNHAAESAAILANIDRELSEAVGLFL